MESQSHNERKDAQAREEALRLQVKELQAELLDNGNRLIQALEADVASGEAMRMLQHELEAARGKAAEMDKLRCPLVADISCLSM